MGYAGRQSCRGAEGQASRAQLPQGCRPPGPARATARDDGHRGPADGRLAHHLGPCCGLSPRGRRSPECESIGLTRSAEAVQRRAAPWPGASDRLPQPERRTRELVAPGARAVPVGRCRCASRGKSRGGNLRPDLPGQCLLAAITSASAFGASLVSCSPCARSRAKPSATSDSLLGLLQWHGALARALQRRRRCVCCGELQDTMGSRRGLQLARPRLARRAAQAHDACAPPLDRVGMPRPGDMPRAAKLACAAARCRASRRRPSRNRNHHWRLLRTGRQLKHRAV